MAQQIGAFGLAAALLSLAGMAGGFTWQTFGVEGAAWDWGYLPRYLHFVIEAITILVCRRWIVSHSLGYSKLFVCIEGQTSIECVLWHKRHSQSPLWDECQYMVHKGFASFNVIDPIRRVEDVADA